MSTALLIGLPCGLSAAILQSTAYIASRHYTASRGLHAGLALMVLMHLWLGLFAMLTLPFVYQANLPWGTLALPMILCAVFNVAGQLGLTISLRLAEPSRVSPLLTTKVFFPAMLSTLIGAPVGAAAYSTVSSMWQWLAVALCIVAGVLISRGGGGMKKSAMAAILFTVLVFAGSDWCIGISIGRILTVPGITSLHAALLTTALLYLMTAVVGLGLLPFRLGVPPGRKTYGYLDWRDSLPYAACWYMAMVVLFVAFAEVGLVLGTILQCTRSIITILMSVGLMYLGHAHIEPRKPHSVVLVRVAAGVLMFLAITLYVLRGTPLLPKTPIPPADSKTTAPAAGAQ